MWGCSGAGCPPDYRPSPRSCLSSITVGSTMWGSQPSRNCGARRKTLSALAVTSAMGHLLQRPSSTDFSLLQKWSGYHNLWYN